ncbi:MAG: hypothetical protein AB7H70_01775 [Rhodospirillaceae bacterium]
MSVLFRLTDLMLNEVVADLRRVHAFAAERVGFIAARPALSGNTLVLVADFYHPVADHHYIDDPSVGAKMGQEAIRCALEIALLKRVGMFHIHLHDFPGDTRFSAVDVREHSKFVPDFFNVRKEVPHGAIVLSPSGAAGRCWLAKETVVPITEFHVAGPVKKGNPARGPGGLDVSA